MINILILKLLGWSIILIVNISLLFIQPLADFKPCYDCNKPKKEVTIVTKPIYQPKYYPKGNYYPLIQKYFPKEQWENANKVMLWESGGNPMAIGRAGEIGLFQIMLFPNRPSREQLFNPEVNVKYAASLYGWRGWKPWTSARRLGL